VLAAAALCCAAAYASGEFTFSASIDRSEALLGDEIRLKVVITAPEGEDYTVPESPDIGKLRLVDRKVGSEKKRGEVVKTVTFTLAGFELGDFTIAPMPVLSPVGDTGLKTEEFKVKIVGQIPPGEQPEMKDVLPPVPIYERTWIMLYIMGGLAAAVAAFFLIRRYIRRRRLEAGERRRRAEEAERLRPAHEVALEKLDALLKEDLLKKGQYRIFCFRISEIIRGYVGRRFAFDSLELTTTELMEAARSRYTAGLDLDELCGFCNSTDLVKFAKAAPTDAEISRMVDAAYSIVRSTSVDLAPKKPDGGADSPQVAG
jgi:hypothetical protein